MWRLGVFSLYVIFVSAASDKCSTCKEISSKFRQGMVATENHNFGGGNTAWEEKHQGDYKNSETRLVEIIEQVCGEKSHDCLSFLEDGEEHIEHWWKHRQEDDVEDELEAYLCITKLPVCCPAGHFGKACSVCPGLSGQPPCSGHGKCQGDGTRTGKGDCQCSPGYIGKSCAKCKKLYYTQDGECKQCNSICAKGCKGSGPADCIECHTGYVKDGGVCVDQNECVGAHNCSSGFYCSNTIGSFSCNPCHGFCDPTKGCTGADATNCLGCAAGSEPTPGGTGCQDVDECLSSPCSQNYLCTNLAGSFSCACGAPFVQVQGECKLPEPPVLSDSSEIKKDEL